MKRDDALFYLCSLIEFIGRRRKLERSRVVDALGEETLRRIYDYADVFHCEPIEKTADDFIRLCAVPEGVFDNVAACRYRVPDYWMIGEVYERLIEDVNDGDVIETLRRVYASWISEALSDYNTDFYYQPRDYVSECCRAGEVLD
ncbi:MAG: hypothetical protein J6Z30_07670 [Pyramidobacter sp.]|nr:hypothetical protein [Pyramidobacter sp.]